MNTTQVNGSVPNVRSMTMPVSVRQFNVASRPVVGYSDVQQNLSLAARASRPLVIEPIESDA